MGLKQQWQAKFQRSFLVRRCRGPRYWNILNIIEHHWTISKRHEMSWDVMSMMGVISEYLLDLLES